MLTKTISQKSNSTMIMPFLMAKAIIEELKLLRKELSFVLPQDDLENYSHPERICTSYAKAVKDYPPANYENY